MHGRGLRVSTEAQSVEQLLEAGLLGERPRVEKREDGPDVWVVRDPDGNAVELELLGEPGAPVRTPA